MTTLTNIRNLGRFENTITGKKYNIKKGRKKDIQLMFYFIYLEEKGFILLIILFIKNIKKFFNLYKY